MLFTVCKSTKCSRVRFYSKKHKPPRFPQFEEQEFKDAIGEIPDIPEMNVNDPEFQQQFISSLSPELQDLFYKGARGEMDEYELSKYMRTQMTETEMQKIAESPMFQSVVGKSHPKNSPLADIPEHLDPDVKVETASKNLPNLSRKDEEMLSSVDRSSGKGQGEEEEGREGQDGGIDQEKLHRLLSRFQSQGKNDRFEKTDFKVTDKERERE